jgi:hypothetical protein
MNKNGLNRVLKTTLWLFCVITLARGFMVMLLPNPAEKEFGVIHKIISQVFNPASLIISIIVSILISTIQESFRRLKRK